MELIILWISLSVCVGILANRYNRGPFLWTFVSLLVSPLISWAFVMALGRKPESEHLRRPTLR